MFVKRMNGERCAESIEHIVREQKMLAVIIAFVFYNNPKLFDSQTHFTRIPTAIITW